MYEFLMGKSISKDYMKMGFSILLITLYFVLLIFYVIINVTIKSESIKITVFMLTAPIFIVATFELLKFISMLIQKCITQELLFDAIFRKKSDAIYFILKLFIYYELMSIYLLILISNSILSTGVGDNINEIHVAAIVMILAFIPRLTMFIKGYHESKLTILTLLGPLTIFSIPFMLFYSISFKFDFSVFRWLLLFKWMIIFIGDGTIYILQRGGYLQIELDIENIDSNELAQIIHKKGTNYNFSNLKEEYFKSIKDDRYWITKKIEDALLELPKLGMDIIYFKFLKENILGEIESRDFISNFYMRVFLLSEDRNCRNPFSIVWMQHHIRKKQIVKFALSLLEDSKSQNREIASQTLIHYGDSSFLDKLTIAMEDPSPIVRSNIAKTLGNLGDPDSLETLKNHTNDKSFVVRENVAYALGKFNDSTIINNLIKMADDKNEYVRKQAIKSLGNFNDKLVVEVLINNLFYTKYGNYFDIIEALKKLNHKDICDNLINKLDSKDLVLKAKAMRALGLLKCKDAAKEIYRLDIENDTLLQIAIQSLGEIGNTECIPFLKKALQSKNSNIRRDAIYSLMKIKDESTIESLMNTLNDTNKYVREASIEALANIGGRIIEDIIIEKLDDSESNVIITAIKCIGRLKSEKGIEHLINLLENADRKIRIEIINALAKIGTNECIEYLVELIHDSNDEEKIKIIDHFSIIGNEHVIKNLISYLNDRNNDIVYSSLKTLIALNANIPKEIALKLLESKNQNVKFLMAKHLSLFGNEEAIKSLISFSSHETLWLAREAVIVLGSIQCEKSVKPMKKLLSNYDPLTHFAIIKALEEIGGEEAKEILMGIATDELLIDWMPSISKMAGDILDKR